MAKIMNYTDKNHENNVTITEACLKTYANQFFIHRSLNRIKIITHTRARSCKKIVGLLSRCVTTFVPITLPKYALFRADSALKHNKFSIFIYLVQII